MVADAGSLFRRVNVGSGLIEGAREPSASALRHAAFLDRTFHAGGRRELIHVVRRPSSLKAKQGSWRMGWMPDSGRGLRPWLSERRANLSLVSKKSKHRYTTDTAINDEQRACKLISWWSMTPLVFDNRCTIQMDEPLLVGSLAASSRRRHAAGCLWT